MSNQQHQSSLVRSRTKTKKPCIGDGFPMRRIVRGQFNVFAFEHTQKYWHRWTTFATRREALAWCRGKFAASCGVRVVFQDTDGKLTIVNPFPKAEPCLPCRVEFAS